MSKFIIINITILILMATNLQADVLIIDRINNTQDFAIPQRGATKEQVLSNFGEPDIKKTAVGEPPITVWQYQKFSVYFERNWVINTVVSKSSPEEKGPKSIN